MLYILQLLYQHILLTYMAIIGFIFDLYGRI